VAEPSNESIDLYLPTPIESTVVADVLKRRGI